VALHGRGRSAQFIPIRFIFWNKLTRDDRLLVAFDVLVLSEFLDIRGFSWLTQAKKE
jgi:hypothetical protein